MTIGSYEEWVEQTAAQLGEVMGITPEYAEILIRDAMLGESKPLRAFGLVVRWRWWQRPRWAWRLIRRVGYWYDRRQR